MTIDLPNRKNAKLTRTDIQETAVHSNNPLRTITVDGFFGVEPKVGQPFRFFSKSLTAENDMRLISTSTVQSVAKVDGKVLIHTLNSTYELEILPAMAEA